MEFISFAAPPEKTSLSFNMFPLAFPPHKPSFLQCILWSRTSSRKNVTLSISIQETQFRQSLRRSIIKCQPKSLKYCYGLRRTEFKFNFENTGTTQEYSNYQSQFRKLNFDRASGLVLSNVNQRF